MKLINISSDTFLKMVIYIEKQSGDEILHDDFYGDPTCGLIGKTNEGAIIAGALIKLCLQPPEKDVH